MNRAALRRALHQCVDILVDALVEEDEKPKKRRGPSSPTLPPKPQLPAELQRQLESQLAKAGYKKAG